jgi:hypothetical protein
MTSHEWLMTLTRYPDLSMPTPEDLIRSARARSNRGIAERNAYIVAESLDKDFLELVS